MNSSSFTISELMDQISAVTTSDNIILLISDLTDGTILINVNEDDGSFFRYTINVPEFKTMTLPEIRKAVQSMRFEGISIGINEIIFYMKGDGASADIRYQVKGDEE